MSRGFSASRRQRSRPAAWRPWRPRVEGLEGRYLPSTVTNLNDSGAGSLRYAVATAQAGGTVDFQPGLSGTITLTSATLTIDHSLTITGPGAKALVVNGNQQFMVFQVSAGVTATLAGLSIVSGNGTSHQQTDGGGISNQGTLTVTGCTISGSYAGYGGGIFNAGTLTVQASTLSGNTADPGYSNLMGAGGGIYNAAAANLTVISSTLSGNQVVYRGIHSVSSGYGGGIFNAGNLTVISSTVSLNSVGARQAAGGGIDSGGSLTLTNTIVAGNTEGGDPALGSRGPDLSGAVTQSDHNLVGIGDGSTGLVNGQNGNQVGTGANPIDPKLGPLQDNGGPTPTQALLAGSPAIGAGDPAAAPGPTDQRGFPRLSAGRIDIGAYEVPATSLGKPIFAIGGGAGRLLVYRDADNVLLADFAPYGAAYTGPISVAVGDVNGDGVYDLVTGAAAGNPDVHVYDGQAFARGTFDPTNPNASLIAQWFAYGLNFNVGANVAVGAIEHDGFADIVTGATVGNPDVRVYRGQDIANHDFEASSRSLLAQWFPYALGFNVGANVAVGDVNGDGFADVVTGATAGNPDVRVFSGKDIAQGTFNPTGSSQLAQLFAYALNFDVGAFVAVGDTTGSGFGDIITGASTGNPDVRVFSGKDIAQGTFNPTGASQLDQFFAYGLNFNIGAAVAAADFENDGKYDILTGASAGAPHYRVVKGNATGIQPPALFEAIPSDLQGGIAVGA
jgi:hypothetical protein